MTLTSHVALSANERYMPGALVAAAGVAVNARPETALFVHLFTEDVTDSSFTFFKSTLRRLHPNIKVERHACDERSFTGLPSWKGSKMAAMRCHYADLLPDVDWCLYLDCDVLYLASIEEHFSLRDEGVFACVVTEESRNTRDKEREWIRKNCGVEIPDQMYFNSGVVLFNLRLMREEGIPAKLINFFATHSRIPSPDQDALNAVLAGRVRVIPPKFDRLQIILDDRKLAEHPVIHYVGGNPWLPKFGVMPNNRFRLWHGFADKFIWLKRGESQRRCFPLHMRVSRKICYHILKCPGIGSCFAWLMEKSGVTRMGAKWRWLQTGNDISRHAVKEMLG